MAAQGKKVESFNDQLYAGIVTVKRIVAVNPTVKERAKLYGRELTEKEEENPDIDYLGETDDGEKKVKLIFYLETTHPVKKIIPYRIELVDKVRRDKDGVKYQIVNQTAETTFVVPDDNNEPDYETSKEWFRNFQDKDENNIAPKSVRKALVGEEQLMKLLRAAFKFHWRDPDTSIVYDYNKFFKGNVKELEGDLLNESITGSFDIGVDVTKSKDGEKSYENVYGKFFLPSGTSNFLVNKNFPNKYMRTQWEKFVDDVEGEYGTKGYLPFSKLDVYNPEEDEANAESISSDKEVSSKYD